MTWLADVAPELMSLPPSNYMATAAGSGFVLLAVGAALLGVTSIRARVLPRWVSVLLVVCGSPSLVAGFPPFLLPLGCAVAVIGWFVLRAATYPSIEVRVNAGLASSLV